MAWVDSRSEHFVARHAEAGVREVAGMLELLEATRERLGRALPRLPGEVAVVVHDRPAALTLAQPVLPLVRAATAPASRRYVAGWVADGRLDVLSPSLLEARASSVSGSREMLALAPAALYAQLALAGVHGAWPPPLRPARVVRAGRWAWLWLGGAAWLAGQTEHARPAIGRRLREGGRPAFPPAPRDAALLGGTVLDLLAGREGDAAAVTLAATAPRGRPHAALAEAFHAPADEVEAHWRGHLNRLVGR